MEVSVPKREGQYIGEIEMETDYEVSENERGNTLSLVFVAKSKGFIFN